ncbi:integrase arm-type DNA-binding domain-containing protein [Desulfovibrio sp. OttesenSCG-928-A18]|nr:integrase arm-type DNA-binding domain-containing protein [Desulfovibrio sp. OttesenSCG-928-A18]
MPLTDTAIRSARPGEKTIKLFDGGGLYLELSPKGGKWWRLKYRLGGKEKRVSLGVYPTVGLKEARERREQAKKLIDQGIDPSEQKKEAKALAAAEAREQAATFEAVSREWYAKKTAHLTEDYRKQIISRLERMIFPHIGSKPFSSLEPADILIPARQAESRGAIETAHRLVRLAGQVCRYARLVGYCKYDVAAGLTEALPSVQTKHLAAITDPAQVGHLLRAIDEYRGDISIAYAMKILPYTFVRSGELRAAEWAEIDLDGAEWVVPAGRMKMRQPHVVPLARQVVELFAAMREYSGGGKLVFPSPFSATRCISDMGLLNALRRMGYEKGVMTIHGFRGMASTLLNEQGYRPDVIEAQLAHGERNTVRKAYNHAEYLPERRRMMQEWADFLDGLREQS